MKLGRPSKSLISRESAIQAALDLIDEHGLDTLSLGLVASRMNVRAPSLYHYFSDKADLLAGVAQKLLLEIQLPEPSGDWEEMLIELSVATRRTILQHPHAAMLLLRFFPRHIMLPAYEFWTNKCPYPPAIRLLMIEGSEKLSFGSALFAASAAAYSMPAMPDVDAALYPALAEAVNATSDDDEHMFVETIRTFLAGLRSRYGAVENDAGAEPAQAASHIGRRVAVQ